MTARQAIVAMYALRAARALALGAAVGLALGPQASLAQPGGVTVQGVAYDSLRNAPLAGGIVWLVELRRSAMTDENGRFAFDGVAPGRHTFTLNHDAVDSLGLGAITRRADVADRPATIVLAIPAFEAQWRGGCGRAAPRDTLLLYGAVRRSGDDAPVGGARVQASWHDFDVEKRTQVVEKARTLETLTDASGAFGFCGVPVGVGLSVRALTDSAASGTIALPPSTDLVRWIELAVGPAGGAAGAPGEAERGTIRGVVLRRGGSPVADARVGVEGQGEVRTDSTGRFTLGGVATGSRQVYVLSIGQAEATRVVKVVAGQTAEVAFTVEALTTLDASRVIAPSPYHHIVAAIADRRKVGFGKFYDSTMVGNRGTMQSVFNEAPGLKVRPMGRRNYILYGKDYSGRDCTANIFIDGVQQFDQETLWLVYPDEVAVIEVYARGMMVPAEFAVPRSTCGAVAIWTKRKMP